MKKRIKRMPKGHNLEPHLSSLPNFHYTGSVSGMRKIYGDKALLVRCGSWIYNCEQKPFIYEQIN